MNPNEPVTLTRDVDATIVPAGTHVKLMKGEMAQVTQSLGGSYTVILNGNMFRIDGTDADALGMEEQVRPASSTPHAATQEEVEKSVWDQLKTCYDPEIPVNIVDLGLVYDCVVEPSNQDTFKVSVKMTLTAPGCGMGPVLQQDAQNKILCLDPVDDVSVELVWDPPWNQSMLTEAAKLQLGLM
jgi:probable FeS assembly SUF system protein SufT